MPKSWAEIGNLDALERQTRSDVRLIAEKGHGRAACETQDLCYWAHQQFEFDYFNFGQRLIVGKEPMTECDSIFDEITYRSFSWSATSWATDRVNCHWPATWPSGGITGRSRRRSLALFSRRRTRLPSADVRQNGHLVV